MNSNTTKYICVIFHVYFFVCMKSPFLSKNLCLWSEYFEHGSVSPMNSSKYRHKKLEIMKFLVEKNQNNFFDRKFNERASIFFSRICLLCKIFPDSAIWRISVNFPMNNLIQWSRMKSSDVGNDKIRNKGIGVKNMCKNRRSVLYKSRSPFFD